MPQFIESIKLENQEIFLLDLHQKRVNETFLNFGKNDSIDLKMIFKNLNINENGLFKLRIVYDLNRNFQTQLIPYTASKITDFQLIENDNFNYMFKFSDRKEFENMKAKSNAEEIIIVKNNHITDTSFSNLLFLKGKEWFTPTTCLLNGVQRQHLLMCKKIKTTEITLNNLNEFTHFQIINAMNDFDEMFIYPIEKIVNLPENKVFF
ncbi:MAG: aminotransferase class IV [Flavobacteriaceae bacterium]|jgi:4-amino-4-deoxychorismate lyase|nr:aminotransferase class IV [Flavobacteriaceae bacterium]